VRKPGAFRRYVFREAPYPALTFRRAYDKPVAKDEARADLEYVRILHLTAGDGERAVDAVLALLLSAGMTPYYETVRMQVRSPRTGAGIPDVIIGALDLTCYDKLLVAHTGERLMSARSSPTARGEVLEQRLKGLRLPGFLVPGPLCAVGQKGCRRRLEGHRSTWVNL
jgi:hypothetical protein